ncbi:hypothetical protein JCM6882_006758 [Rhodosporidiobolus microsporus]
MARGVSDVYDPALLATRSFESNKSLHPTPTQPQRHDTLGRSNTTTSISTFFFGGRRRSDPCPSPRLPAPPPNYEHVDVPLSQARLHHRAKDPRIAALRASKLVVVEKMTSADRMANWMERTDPEMSKMERWRRRVEEEVRMEREERELVAAAEREALAAEMDKALPELPRSAFSNSNEDGDTPSPTVESAEGPGLSRSDSTVTGETAASAAVVATAEVLPSARARSVSRCTLIGDVGSENGGAEVPPLPSQPVPPPSYRFPSTNGAAPAQSALPPIDTSFRPGHPAASCSLSSAPPRPWHGTPPPRTSSLPFNNLAHVAAPPPQCSILPPKAAALLGLIPSASAPLDLRPPAPSFTHREADTLTAVSSSRLAVDTPPRPPFFAYNSFAGSSTRKDSLDTASLSASTRTAGSFWSHNTPHGGGRPDFASLVAGRPSYDSGSVPTTASPQQLHPHNALPVAAKRSAESARNFPLGVGSSFSAALAQSQARGATSRTKGPPRRLHPFNLRKEGMSSSPDLTTPLREQAAASMLPMAMRSQTQAQAQVQERYAVVTAGACEDEEETESLIDVPFYKDVGAQAAAPRSRRGVSNQITAASLRSGWDEDEGRPSRRAPPRSSSLSRDGGSVVGSLVRSLSKSGGSSFLTKKLSSMGLRAEHEKAEAAGGAAKGGIRALGRKLSLRQRDEAATRTAAVRFAPAPTPLVEKKVKRRTRDEWEMDSREIARRMQWGLSP